MFISYWFIVFASLFFPVYWLTPFPVFRKTWILLGSITFHYNFAGPAGVAPIALLAILTYFAALSNIKLFRLITIILCVCALLFYKYATFFLAQTLNLFDPHLAEVVLEQAQLGLLPQAPPLAISFFVFEFVHYLVDVHKGKPAIRSAVDFTLFSVFWPSVVSGPVKRFEQFIPALKSGCRQVNALDIQIGTLRIASGLLKKLLIADNLTSYIQFWQPQFATLALGQRWLLVMAISMRILFDFSGYSDIAIGFARLMGIRLPENFNWPYLASSLQEFWRRWHISLSTWIRDYIYIPLGGSQHGPIRKITNGVIAFAICGLWHGAAWNFICWGLYHGIGLVIFAGAQSWLNRNKVDERGGLLFSSVGWLITFTYVSIGWLFFFYPVQEALTMLFLLIQY